MLLAELGSKSTDVDIDGPGAPVVLVSPDPAEQGLAGEHLCRVAGKEAQQFVLHVGQVEDPIFDRGSVGLEVDDEWSGLDDLAVCPATEPLELEREPSRELSGAHRSDDKIVEEIITQRELADRSSLNHQEEGSHRIFASSQRPTYGQSRSGIVTGDDDGATKAAVGHELLDRLGRRSTSPGVPCLAEGEENLRRGGVREADDRVHVGDRQSLGR